MQQISVRGEYITLGQLLKVIGAVGSGGDVRGFLEESEVRVNGEPENRRGRKLRPGDTVSLSGQEEVRLVVEEAP